MATLGDPLMRRPFKLLTKTLALAALLTGAASAQAWGDFGHKVSARIAQSLLKPDAQAQVIALAGSLDLASLANYLDSLRDAPEKDRPDSSQWHYDKRPLCLPAAVLASYCPDDNCASIQITKHERILMDTTQSAADRLFALQVLVHVVGDIHQPLHSMNYRGTGGNNIKVKLAGFPTTLNLHTAWDNALLWRTFKSVDHDAIALALLATPLAANLPSYLAGTPTEWLAESYAIASETAFGRLPKFSCGLGTKLDAITTLNTAYVTKAKQIIPLQLLKAGARIAHVLNRALAKP